MPSKNSPRGRLFTVTATAPLLGYQPQTFYNSIHSGEGELSKLPYYRIGRSIRFAEEDLERFIAERRVVPEGGK